MEIGVRTGAAAVAAKARAETDSVNRASFVGRQEDCQQKNGKNRKTRAKRPQKKLRYFATSMHCSSKELLPLHRGTMKQTGCLRLQSAQC